MKQIAIVSVLFGLWTVPADALSPADKCESAKLKEAGKFSFCRMKAEAKAVKTGQPADYSKCDERFTFKWPLIETKAGSSCPSDGDESAIQAFLTQQADTVATALAGGGLADCAADLSSCTASLAACQAAPASRLLKTGQFICSNTAGTVIACAGTGQDGEVGAGIDQAYVNNGDGTITDTQTGLMWEVISDDGSIHDRDNVYTWSAAFTRVGQLNTDVFAGYSDWRLPNRSELISLQNMGAEEPSVFPAFNTNCSPGCAVTTCSCVSIESYWSSTTFHGFRTLAWLVDFRFASTSVVDKTEVLTVRAVRDN